jgi:hypothetical protein
MQYASRSLSVAAMLASLSRGRQRERAGSSRLIGLYLF